MTHDVPRCEPGGAACRPDDAPARLYGEWARVHATCRMYFWGSDATTVSPSRDVPNRRCSAVG